MARILEKMIICLTFVFVGITSSFFVAYSAPTGTTTAQYVNKELIPNQEEGTSDFVQYLGQLYTFGIGFAAVLAVLMITFGAFVYIVTSAGNVAKMMDAKEMIFNAIYGLILAMLAYLILSLINIDLVNGKVRMAPPTSYLERSSNEIAMFNFRNDFYL